MSGKKTKTKKKTKQKSSRKKGDDTFMVCKDLAFTKEPSEKQRRVAVLQFTFECNHGEWKNKKPFDDVWKFLDNIQSSNDGKRDKSIQKAFRGAKSARDDFIKNGNSSKILNIIRTFMTSVGKNKKLCAQSTIAAFCGAKREFAKSMQSLQTMDKKSKSKANDPPPKRFTIMGNDSNRSSVKYETELKVNTNANAIADRDILQSLDMEYGTPFDHQHQVNNDRMVDELQMEISQMKSVNDRMERKYMSQVHELRQTVSNLQSQNQALTDTLSVQTSTNKELLDKVESLKHELGKDTISSEAMALFQLDDEVDDDPAEKYFLETISLKKRLNELEETLKSLVNENEVLKQKRNRQDFILDELTNELVNTTQKDFEQLESDYKEVEAECDELHDQLQGFRINLKNSNELIVELHKLIANNKSKVDEYPQLQAQIDKKRQEIEQLRNVMGKVTDERDKFEDRFLQLNKKQPELMAREDHKSQIKKMRVEMQEVFDNLEKVTQEKMEALKVMENGKNEMADIKIENGQLSKENEKLVLGGGQNVNLGIDMDLELQFSAFKHSEFDFPPNVSREQLRAWAEHVKILIAEIQEELCLEVNELSKRKELLENYIECKGIPFPEEVGFGEDESALFGSKVCTLPHPLSSMTWQELQEYEPTKGQLQEYIDLMFSEWRNDEYDHESMIMQTNVNEQLVKELMGNNDDDVVDVKEEKEEKEEKEVIDNGRNSSVSKKIDELHLKIAEMEEEQKLVKKQKESEIEQLEIRIKEMTKAQRKESFDKIGQLGPRLSDKSEDTDVQQKQMEDSDGYISESNVSLVSSEETILLKNQLGDVEQYAKTITDDMRQLQFECDQQKNIMQREHLHDLDILRIDLEEARAEADDLTTLLQAEHLDSAANEFRLDIKEERAEKSLMKKAHIQEVRELEKDRDELLREINLLRIKTDRMDADTDDEVAKITLEMERIKKELDHFVIVAGNVEEMREMLNRAEDDREQGRVNYQRLEEEQKATENMHKEEIEQRDRVNSEMREELNKSEMDYKRLKDTGDEIISRRELNELIRTIEEQENQLHDAISSKFRLLQTSSLEIDRLRDEIRLICGDRMLSKRDFEPNRFHSGTAFVRYPIPVTDDRGRMLSVSSLGSNIPLHSSHLTPLDEVSYTGQAWNYTLGVFTGAASFFGYGDDRDGSVSASEIYSQSSVYSDQVYGSDGAHQDSRRSSLYEPHSRLPSSARHNSRMHSMRRSMVGASNANVRHHSHGMSELKRSHSRRHTSKKLSRMNSKQYRSQRLLSLDMNDGYHHKPKQLSKQQSLLQGTENEKIAGEMENIFDMFDKAEENMRTSQDFNSGKKEDRTSRSYRQLLKDRSHRSSSKMHSSSHRSSAHESRIDSHQSYDYDRSNASRADEGIGNILEKENDNSTALNAGLSGDFWSSNLDEVELTDDDIDEGSDSEDDHVADDYGPQFIL